MRNIPLRAFMLAAIAVLCSTMLLSAVAFANERVTTDEASAIAGDIMPASSSAGKSDAGSKYYDLSTSGLRAQGGDEHDYSWYEERISDQEVFSLSGETTMLLSDYMSKYKVIIYGGLSYSCCGDPLIERAAGLALDESLADVQFFVVDPYDDHDAFVAEFKDLESPNFIAMDNEAYERSQYFYDEETGEYYSYGTGPDTYPSWFMREWGYFKEGYSGLSKSWCLTTPAVLFVAKDGIVLGAEENPDLLEKLTEYFGIDTSALGTGSNDSGSMFDVSLEVTYGQTEARTMLDSINAFRTGDDAWAWNADSTQKERRTGLKPLAYDYELERIAKYRAAEIALSFSHTTLDGKSKASAMAKGLNSWGENIAAGRSSAAETFVQWREDDEPYSGQGHRRNMLNSNYTSVGIGHVACNGFHYWVQEFGAPALSTTATEPDDSTRIVSLRVSTNIITNRSISADVEDIVLNPGDSAKLPEVSAGIGTKDTWPYDTTPVITGWPSWSVEDTTVARVSGNRIEAVGPGKTRLKAIAALDESVELFIPVEVASVDIPHEHGAEHFEHDLDWYLNASSPSTYSPELSHMLMAIASSAYTRDNITTTFKNLGFPDSAFSDCAYTSGYNTTNINNIGFAFNVKDKAGGGKLALIAISGSHAMDDGKTGTMEWLSNFTLGEDVLDGHFTHWGFTSAAKTIFTAIKTQLGEIPTKDVTYVVTGHSRGAGVGNLVEMMLVAKYGVPSDRVYGYNFACPDTAVGTSSDWASGGKYSNIFNIGNCQDPVSYIPGVFGNALRVQGITTSVINGQWGKFGRSLWFAEDGWESNDIWKINLDAHDWQTHYLAYLHQKPKPGISSFKGWADTKAAQVKACGAQTTDSLKGVAKALVNKAYVLAVHCPTDVIVTDSSSKTVAAITGGQVDYCGSDFGDILLFVVGDEKFVVMPRDQGYNVSIRGTAAGSMAVELSDVSPFSGTASSTSTYSDVKLTAGKQFEMQLEKDTKAEDAKLYVDDSNGNRAAEVMSNGEETKLPQAQKTSISKATITGLKSRTYTGKAITQAPVVKIGGKTLNSGTDYTTSYKNNEDAGTATLTVTGKGNYAGTKSATFKINKAKNTMAAKAKSKTLKAKSLKTKKATVKKLVTVKKAMGKVTYKNVSTQKASKQFMVNAKNGTMTIPKGTETGAYKAKVKVTAKGNANYKSGSKTVTVKIQVK